MGLRRQLPAYSPVRLGSLLAGATGALGVGDPIGALGRRLTAHFGTPDHLLVDSGTSGLRLAIEGARSMHGGRTVALPAYCCYDVATAAIGAGAGIRLYDIDPITLGPDWPSLEGVLSPDVSSVVAVHLYGVPVDVPRMAALAARVGAVLIEDAAQGVGGSIDERPLGVHGSLGVLSFGRGKGLTGGGGGAVLATDDIGRAALMAVGDRPAVGLPGWRGLLRLAGQWLLGRPSVYGIPSSLSWLGLGETHYREPWEPRFIAPGHAAAVLANWEASLAEAEVRRRNAAVLRESIGQTPEADAADALRGATGACLRLPVLLDVDGLSPSARESLGPLGVVAGYPSPLDSIAGAGASITGSPDHPGADSLARNLMTLPVHGRSRPERTGSAVSLAGPCVAVGR